MIYLDTSIVAPLYWAETLSDKIEELVLSETELGLSQLVEVELVSTLSRRVRMREISHNSRDIITIEEVEFPHAYKSGFVSPKVKMATQKLTLEIPESLLEELHRFAELTGQSVESLAVQSITNSLPQFREKVYDLDELLSQVTRDNLHGEIDSGEPVGREI